jgi:hypothetical protein
LDHYGHLTIDKEHRGERIFARLGRIGQETAEQRLAQTLESLDWQKSGERMPDRSSLTAQSASCLNQSSNARLTTLAGISESFYPHRPFGDQ